MRVAGFMAALALVAPSLANAETQTTVYTYNADGALTSITEMSDGGSKTTYFTWDNFEADPNTPSTGTVTAANGNLIGIGTTPGDDSVSSWHHDVLDRLVRVTNWQGDKALYQYHPDELLAASLNADAPSTDGLQHYYDESRYPQVTNLYDRHTGELSSRHHQIRYLEDGTEQMLVRHRKDVDGVYELTGQTMSGYGYDPYGASLDQVLTGTPPAGPLYSLAANPYRYTHELQDPVSGAYYLRARWYLPGHQTFLQRDPVRNLNRYGYANGNPITNYDPSGRRTTFFKGLAAGLLAQVTFGLEPAIAGIITDPQSYFKDAHNDVALGLSVLGVAAMAGEVLGPFLGGAQLNFLRRFQGFTAWGSLGIGAFSVGQGMLVAHKHPTGTHAYQGGRQVGAVVGVLALEGLAYGFNRLFAERAFRRAIKVRLRRKALPEVDALTLDRLARRIVRNEKEASEILQLEDTIKQREEDLETAKVAGTHDRAGINKMAAETEALRKQAEERTKNIVKARDDLLMELRRLMGAKPPVIHKARPVDPSGDTNLRDHEPTESFFDQVLLEDFQ